MNFVPNPSDVLTRECLPVAVCIDTSESPRFVEVDVVVLVQLRLPDGELVLLQAVVPFAGFPSEGPLRPGPGAGAVRTPTDSELSALWRVKQ